MKQNKTKTIWGLQDDKNAHVKTQLGSPGTFRMISYLKWCELESERMNLSGGKTHVLKQGQLCCIN